MDLFDLTPAQKRLARPTASRVFLQGPAGSGKTTAGVYRLQSLLLAGIPAEQILVMVPQRTLAFPYMRLLGQPGLPPGGVVDVVTLGGLSQRLINLFWPLIAPNAGFAHPNQPPSFLTLETAQYYLAQIVSPLLEEGYFESVTIDPNRLFSQILDNLNKAAAVGFPHTAIAEKLIGAWSGESGRRHTYEQAQECANRFRQFCWANNLLDFSLQLEMFTRQLWPSLLIRQYLTHRYRHLIFDNLEEDVPVVFDVLRDWLPEFETALLIYDTGGGFRTFLGADPQTALELRGSCDEEVTFSGSLVTPPEIETFEQALDDCTLRQPTAALPRPGEAFELENHRFFPDMLASVARKTAHLVHEAHNDPGQIVILAPFLSDSLRFSLMNQLQALDIPIRSHRPSRALRDEPAAQCLLTLARLAHPAWQSTCTRHDVRSALMQSISDCDLVRADLLAQMLYSPSNHAAGLRPFDPIIPEMQERITHIIGGRYEQLRLWLEDYRAGAPSELDIFLSRLFGEVLSQPGFGFSAGLDAAAVTARLIESIQKFRWGTAATSGHNPGASGQEYVQMVEQGVVAAQYLQSWADVNQDAVLLAPAYSFLMLNRPAAYQFWLDIGSLGWWERLNQPLTHPYVLSRHWPPNTPWTDLQEFQTNQEFMLRLVNGLLRRCGQRVFLHTTGLNEQGDEQRGPLLQSLQILLRRVAAENEVHDV